MSPWFCRLTDSCFIFVGAEIFTVSTAVLSPGSRVEFMVMKRHKTFLDCSWITPNTPSKLSRNCICGQLWVNTTHILRTAVLYLIDLSKSIKPCVKTISAVSVSNRPTPNREFLQLFRFLLDTKNVRRHSCLNKLKELQ